MLVYQRVTVFKNQLITMDSPEFTMDSPLKNGHVRGFCPCLGAVGHFSSNVAQGSGHVIQRHLQRWNGKVFMNFNNPTISVQNKGFNKCVHIYIYILYIYYIYIIYILYIYIQTPKIPFLGWYLMMLVQQKIIPKIIPSIRMPLLNITKAKNFITWTRHPQ